MKNTQKKMIFHIYRIFSVKMATSKTTIPPCEDRELTYEEKERELDRQEELKKAELDAEFKTRQEEEYEREGFLQRHMNPVQHMYYLIYLLEKQLLYSELQKTCIERSLKTEKEAENERFETMLKDANAARRKYLEDNKSCYFTVVQRLYSKLTVIDHPDPAKYGKSAYVCGASFMISIVYDKDHSCYSMLYSAFKAPEKFPRHQLEDMMAGTTEYNKLREARSASEVIAHLNEMLHKERALMNLW